MGKWGFTPKNNNMKEFKAELPKDDLAIKREGICGGKKWLYKKELETLQKQATEENKNEEPVKADNIPQVATAQEVAQESTQAQPASAPEQSGKKGNGSSKPKK